MTDITLSSIRKQYDRNAIFIVTNNISNSIVVYSIVHGKFVIYWMNLDEDYEGNFTEELSALDKSVYDLTWISNRQAFVKQIGRDRMLNFDSAFQKCTTLINGNYHHLSKVHVEVKDKQWSIFPVISYLEVFSASSNVSEIITHK